MSNVIKIYQRVIPWLGYNMFLYANFILLFVFVLNIPLASITTFSPSLLIVYLLMILGGYFIHDLFDQKEDKSVDKFNILLVVKSRVVMIMIAFFSWSLSFYMLFLVSPIASMVLLIQYLAIIVYSTPFPRLKEKGLIGIVVDALYEHVFMEIVLLLIISQFVDIPFVLWVPFLCYTFSIGVRDILLHQLNDFGNDIKSKTNTFVVQNKDLAANYARVFETVAIVSILFFFLNLQFINYSLVFLALLVALAFIFIAEQFRNESVELRISTRYYIIVSSIIFSYLLIINKFYFGFFLLLHPYFLMFIKNIFSRTILVLLSYILSIVITVSKFVVNNLLYYTFLIGGRNLKKNPLSNTSFLDKIVNKIKD